MKLRRGRDAPQNWAACLNVAAIVLTAHANVRPERAAQVIGMLLGVPVSAGRVDKAAARLSPQPRLARPHGLPSHRS